jgi:hypothetical protein
MARRWRAPANVVCLSEVVVCRRDKTAWPQLCVGMMKLLAAASVLGQRLVTALVRV